MTIQFAIYYFLLMVLWYRASISNVITKQHVDIQSKSITLLFSMCGNIHCVQKKHTHSRFLLYLRGKYLDLHKIVRVCL